MNKKLYEIINEILYDVFSGYFHPDDWEQCLGKFWGRIYEQDKAPTIVCLCGSTRFWRVFQKASLAETLDGKIVLSIGAASGTDDDHFGNLSREKYDQVKAELDELHLRKIDLADEVLILNVRGYIGESTQNELDYARQQGKKIRFLEQNEVQIQLG